MIHSYYFIFVCQVSHALLSVIDQKTGQPFHSTQKRMAVLSKMLRSGVPQSFNWMNGVEPLAISADNASEKEPNHGMPTFATIVFSKCSLFILITD